MAINRKPYHKPSYIRKKAKQRATRNEALLIRRKSRALDIEGSWVIGQWKITDAGTIQFEAIAEAPGRWIDKALPLTANISQMYRWRTPQGVNQYLRNHPEWGKCQTLNLLSLTRRQIC